MSPPVGPPSGDWRSRRRSPRKETRTSDRGTFGGAYGLLFALVVVVSAATATVSLPSESVSADRPHDDVQAVGSGIDRTFLDTNREAIEERDRAETEEIEPDEDERMPRSMSLAGAQSRDEQIGPGGTIAHSPESQPSRAVLPDEVWEDVPVRTREKLRSRLGLFVRQMQAQQSRDGKVTRIKPAGDGIVNGVSIEQASLEHTVEDEVSETYTEKERVIDHYEPVLEGFQYRWRPSRPGAAWSNTGESKEVVLDRDTKWSAQRPGSGWQRTGKKRDVVVDRVYKWSASSLGAPWKSTGNRRKVVVGHDFVWSESKPGSGWKKTGQTRKKVVDKKYKWAYSRPGSRWSKTGQSKSVVVDRDYTWAFNKPSKKWSKTGKRTRKVVDVDYRWSASKPGNGWKKTGDTRKKKVRTKTKKSVSKPGGGWKKVRRVGTKKVRKGTKHRYAWSDSKGGSSRYTRSGYSHAGIVKTKKVLEGTKQKHRWTDSKGDRSRSLLRKGWDYKGVVKKKKLQYRTTTKWIWWYQWAHPDWKQLSKKKVFRGYRTKVAKKRPSGKGWMKIRLDHVKREKVVSYKNKWIWGWYVVYDYVPHVHYKTKKTWVAGRTKWVEKKKWVKGHYKTTNKRKWVGWEKVTKRKWVSGRWKKYTTWKTYTVRKRVCKYRWSWFRGIYKSCSTKKVTKKKKVTRSKWVSGHWKTYTTTKFVGWKTVKSKQWVPGYYKTVTVRKEIPGYWKKEKIKVGVHHHKVPKTVWGPHKEKVEVIDYEQVKYYKWRQPTYQWKYKYAIPSYKTLYKHRYEKPKITKRYKHHYIKPKYKKKAVYKWKKKVYRKQYRYKKKAYDWQYEWVKEDRRTKHRWVKDVTRSQDRWTKPIKQRQSQYAKDITRTERRWLKEDTQTTFRWKKPVYRDEPVYTTILVPRVRTRTITQEVETAPFTIAGDGNWTLAKDVRRARDARLTIERTLLTDDRSNPVTLAATSDNGDDQWRLSVWREDDAIVLETTDGLSDRIVAPFVRIDFDAGTINGRHVGIELAKGVSAPYAISMRNGEGGRGTYEVTLVGKSGIAGQLEDVDAGRARVSVVDGIIYAATFDISYETESTTYTDRITVEPSASTVADAGAST